MDVSLNLPVRSPKALHDLLTGEDVYGTTLLAIAVDTWGTECLEWHPGTLRMEFADQFGVDMNAANQSKLVAAIMVLTTDLFYRDVAAFVHLANCLCGDALDTTTFDPATVAECAWAITEALLLDPPEEGEEKFSEDVRAYLAHALKAEGFVTPPDVLKIALDADFSAQVTYEHSDDPELFSAIHKRQQDKTSEVEDLIRDNLIELVGQLKMLPLRHGNTKDLEERAAKLVKKKP